MDCGRARLQTILAVLIIVSVNQAFNSSESRAEMNVVNLLLVITHPLMNLGSHIIDFGAEGFE